MTPPDASPPPPLAVTMGDPCGIGPEIVAAMALRRPHRRRWIALGDAGVMKAACDALGGGLRIATIADPADAQFEAGVIDLIETSHLTELPPLGRVSAAAGQAAYDAIVAGIDLAKAGSVRGIVTAPINKAALAAAGIRYPGHTEILADQGGGGPVAMMLANDEIRTVLVTIHCSLADAIRRADYPAQMAAMRLAQQAGRALGIEHPRIAVAGLNPHAGEDGLFGDEEIRIIRPAIAAAQAEGIDASGPWPGDTVFMQARRGKFDIVVAQYHDQGLIPVKYMGIETGVNVTLGLPFVRTSPDHGTAFDIAGCGISDPSSLEAAFDYAERLHAAPPPPAL